MSRVVISARRIRSFASAAVPSGLTAAIEGPVAITQCTVSLPGGCAQELSCPVHLNWQKINDAIRKALESVNLSDMARPVSFDPPRTASPKRIQGGTGVS